MGESNSSVAPGWKIGPGWTFAGDYNGGSSESYHYYNRKKRADQTAPKDANAEAAKVDWSQKAVDSENLDRETEAVLAEARRIGTLKDSKEK